MPSTDLLPSVAQRKYSASVVKETLSADLMKSQAVLVFSLREQFDKKSALESYIPHDVSTGSCGWLPGNCTKSL